MQQTIVSVVLPAPPASVKPLQEAVDALRERLGGGQDEFATLRDGMPTLHFLSLVVFDETAGVPVGGAPVTPLLVLEANFDGLPGPFWAVLEAAIGDDLRQILRLCAPPQGPADALFASVTAPGARAPVAPLLERQSVFPAASHAGNRGLGRTRILCHDALFEAVQGVLPPPADVLAGGPVAIHGWLRARVLPQFDWLDHPYPVPVTAHERSADIRALAAFALLAVLVAGLPWLLLGALLHPASACVVALLTGIVALTMLRDIGDLAMLGGVPPDAQGHAYPGAWLLVALGLLLALVLPLDFVRHGWLAWLVLAAAGVVASLLVLLAALRRRERADPVPPDSVPDPVLVSRLHSWEDLHSGGPDHMASLVIIKPGRLRALLIRVGMRALTLAVRVVATDGYLGSMRTIHFAHWAIVDGGRRLVFFSNFDGSWESYLDDFIEKAHAGLTLAWGNCLGFPPPEYLSLKGATEGRKFKAWARCSMTPSRFWYAAYPRLTVNQIVRQAAVARGLCAPLLSPADAALWAKEL